MEDPRTKIIPFLLGVMTTLAMLVWFGVVPEQWLDQIGVDVPKFRRRFSFNENSVQVVAQYKPWFRREVDPTNSGRVARWDHWQSDGVGTSFDPNNILANGQHEIASPYYPLIGPYSSQDPAVIEYHIITAKLAGIQGFTCSWYGPGTYTDQSVGTMIRIAEHYDFKIGVCLEEKSFFPPYSKAATRSEAVDAMKRQLDYLSKQYVASSAFLRHDNLPLIFLNNDGGQSDLGAKKLTAGEIELARESMSSKSLIVRSDMSQDQFPANDGVFVLAGGKQSRDTEYDRLLELSNTCDLKYRAAQAIPGFDDSCVQSHGLSTQKIDRRETEEYTESWNDAIDAELDSVQITTWNDFENGTTIEPTVEYGFDFVDQTEHGVANLTGRVANVKDNQLGLEIYKLRERTRSVSGAGTIDRLTKQIDELALDLFAEGERDTIPKRIESLSKRLERLVPLATSQ